MIEEIISLVSIEEIIQNCSNKAKNDYSTENFVSSTTFHDTWNTFVKWIKTQLDLGRNVTVPGLGTFLTEETEETGDSAILLNLTDDLKMKYGLDSQAQFNTPKKPTVRMNPATLAKYVGVDKTIVTNALNVILDEILDILQKRNCEIDMGQLGKIVSLNKNLKFFPLTRAKANLNQAKQTVKGIFDSQKNKQVDHSPKIKESTYLEQEQNQTKSVVETLKNQQQKIAGTNQLLQHKRFTLKSNKNLEGTFSPMRRYNKPKNMNVMQELLGAGTDPLAKDQDFSLLASKPQELMAVKFIKPNHAQIRFPPVLDPFSRTLAAPISSTKYSFSVSARISSNYNPQARILHLDPESKSIKYLRLKENKTSFSANQELLQELATEEEEYYYIINDRKIQELAQKVQSRINCYERYRQYYQQEIGLDAVAPIRQYWIADILENIPTEYQYLDKNIVEQMVDDMLNEVNRDYYNSSRKSILDYVLKEEDERNRLGVMQVFDAPVDYGQNIYKGVEADLQWRENVNYARDGIASNLVVCSRVTLTLLKLWGKYEAIELFVLPDKTTQALTIQDFVKKQVERMEYVRGLLHNEWTKAIIEIYKEEMTYLSKKQAPIFFQSNATLMSKQVRQLVTDSLDSLTRFFGRFDKNVYKTPEQIIELEEQVALELEDAFLVIQLKDEDDKIVFSDSLDFIKSEILRLIDESISVSYGIQRPEYTLSRSDKTHLWEINIKEENENPIDENYTYSYYYVRDVLDKNIEIVDQTLNLFQKYTYLLTEEDKVNQFSAKPKTREAFLQEMEKYRNLYKEVMEKVPFYVRLCMIEIDCTDVKQKLLNICEELEGKLLKDISNIISEINAKITREIEQMRDCITGKADTAERIVELEANLDRIKKKDYGALVDQYEDLTRWLKMLLNQQFRTTENDLKSIYKTSVELVLVQKTVEDNEVRIANDKDIYEKGLRRKKEIFASNIDILNKEIDKLKDDYTSSLQEEKANEKISSLRSQVNDYLAEGEDINQKEDLIGWQPTEFTELLSAQAKLKPYEDLWNLIRNFAKRHTSWTKDTVVFKLDSEEIDEQMLQMLSTAQKLTIYFPESVPKPHNLTQQVLSDLREFNQHVPVVKCVCNPGLKERHWERISKLGFQIRPDRDINLRQLMDMELNKNITVLQEISDSASKEYGNEKILNKMLEDWEPIICELKPWKDTNTYVVSGNSVDEIQLILDDQIIKTQTMKGSPYAKFFYERITEWENWLIYTQNVVDYWLKVQSVWLYLEPVFSSEDIMKQMPSEGAKFREVDSVWRSIMSKINQNPKALEFTKNPKLLEKLQESHNNLDIVQKGLNNYLESKRLYFPRFYFLSNDDLLSILSETKDPTRVQPHLKKCFEAIQKLQFDENKKIHGMYSSEGEFVPFIKEIDTVAARGNVEQWLLQVEDTMIASIRHSVEKSNKDYTQKPRKEWVLNRCGQAVLAVSMAYWTHGVEQALIDNGLKGLKEYSELLNVQLKEVVELIRQDISVLDRYTLQALIVLDVHNKDVVQNELIQQEIQDINEFSWLAQLRYYWMNDDMWVKIINAKLGYQYEYLGNSNRLVITPLTDRCYRTLCGAMDLNYGGAPEGPAGTGKTETVKDLAKALARQCVVFNCSDGLDYLAMEKFFKGLASSGAWSCFDEFNRIDLEVLSVIAQQILTIQLAVSSKLTEFDFYGVKIKLKPTCNVFITMNPGYAGRSELPDNLKALFRSVAMMVPDYRLIAEIRLFSFGFDDARNLARKIVTTYKLCSEQLSSQDHYDYGMRAVNSVLVAAGNLKRKFPQEKENILIMRAIQDVNLAKFLSQDLPLFKGITSDLFPGVILPEIDYSQLFEAINNQCQKQNLQNTEYFQEKIIQLYEMILVRHGLMVVGYPFGGKTSIIKILADSLGELLEKKQMNENRVKVVTLNPKSITQKQLYGFKDEATNEWTDGVLAVKFKELARSEDNDRKWLVFDGPVDAVWIENMNTVLDDNKKLCLNSGEIIQMSRTMNMIFEPMDLLVASPATVSRCGMVYMEPDTFGWQPLFDSWIHTFPSTYRSEDIDEIIMLFQWLVDPLLYFLRHKVIETTPTLNANLVVSLMKLFRSLLSKFDNQEYYNKFEIKSRLNIIDNLFIFALIWSLGASAVFESRKPFDLQVKKIVSGDIAELRRDKKIYLPDRGVLYDYSYVIKSEKGEGEWIPWLELIDKEKTIPKRAQPQEIIVQTVDTVRYSFLLKTYINREIPTLFCGPTGTGKSVYVKNILMNELSPENYVNLEIGFSAQTSENQTQEIIDSKLDRRKKGVYGPPLGKKCIMFVDDLNMPQKEKYGAQPPIELLRQMLDSGGWYDYKDKEKHFKNLKDLIFVAAMGPPGGGRTFITPRLQRHLNLVSFTTFDDDTMNRIFSTILEWYFTNNNFDSDIIKIQNKLIQATLDIYKTAINELLPTPARSHYLFNLRDFSKVIFGICMADKDRINSVERVVRLWTHEVLRVFSDRLINDEDRLILLNHIFNTMKRTLGSNPDVIFINQDINKDGKITTIEEMRGLMFTDFLSPPGAPKRYYEEVHDKQKLQELVENYLKGYESNDKLADLVLFSFAIEHLLIIGRILKQPGGNALLVGVGGSGRQSLTRLAARVMEFNVFQIEISKQYGITEWRDDIKKVLKLAGGKGQQTVFLFTDSQIKYESFVEDLNNLLNSGEVPNLFAADEKSEVVEMVRNAAKAEGKAPDGTYNQLYAYFIERIRKLMHIVLCFSPIGEAFRNRIRQFPSLVNCCTIDWFSEWPNDALVSVAKQFLTPIQMDQNTKNACTVMVQHFHESTIKWSKQFVSELGRKYYVTPTSYLQMIITFKNLLSEKRKEVQFNQNKYENGYQQIIQTESTVEIMQKELIELQPKLKIAAEDTEKKMGIVSVKKEEADKKKEIVSAEEDIAKKAAAKANAIKTDCEADLEKAKPALLAAEEALNELESQKRNVQDLKKLLSPPIPIRMVLQAVVLLFKVSPIMKRDEKLLKNVPDWWATSIKFISDVQFFEKLKNFPKEQLDDKTIKTLGDFLEHPDSKPYLDIEAVRQASPPCVCMMNWVNGLYQWYFVYKEVLPKEKALNEAQEIVDDLNSKLAGKQAELKIILDNVAQLQAELEASERKKRDLEWKYDDCSKKLVRAKKLIESLGGEKGRWGELAIKLKEDYKNLTGDVLISSGMIAYLGAFTAAYRTKIIQEWTSKVLTMQIPGSQQFQLLSVLGDAVKIRQWNIEGLPSDSFSVENAIIISKSSRWPLCIDPQGQANKWIKNMEKHRKLSIIKLSDTNYLRTLENAIQFGYPVLLENILEDVDPALSPILLKQTFMSGNTLYIKLGEQTIEYSADFAFYITTKLRNPHYLPELSIKVTLLNFMITQEGLNDQLLGILVKKERPDLEQEKERLILESASNKKQLQEIEEKILQVLSGSKMILEDETAIEVLTASKVKSNEVKEKQAIAEKTEQEIDSARKLYLEVSQQAACLFFAISDLGNIDPMYQYSLSYFIDLFTQSIIKSPQSDILSQRLGILKSYFLLSLYRNICRSLFEKDKLLFSFMLSVKLLEFKGLLNQEQWRFLLTGGVALDEIYPDIPQCNWLSEKAWKEICRLSKLDGYQDLDQNIKNNIKKWEKLYESSQPHREILPEPYNIQLNNFQKLLIIRSIRPDKLVPAILEYVKEDLGPEFIDPPPFDLEQIYNDSLAITPLIFVLSPGSDPFISLNQFAKVRGKTPLLSISLGQGQGPIAKKMIQEGIETGRWVVLQNCHLAVTWMPTLEKICEELSPDPKQTHPEFRLWLTSYPSPDFPVAILQNGVKMTNEPPRGLKANLQGSYLTDPISDMNFFNSSTRPKEFRLLLFGLCFFHAVIQERRKFGPLGWNIPYEFTDSDLRISAKQVKKFLDDYPDEVPFDALRYLTAECNYGGKVTDDKDRRLISTLLNDYYTNKIFDPKYKFSPDTAYTVPQPGEHQHYLDYIRKLPLTTSPEVFGLHTNADITKDLNETNLLLDSILICQSGNDSKEQSGQDEILAKLIKTIMADFPKPFDIEAAQKKYPVQYNESMNTVLTQEMVRFNGLIKIVRSSLRDLDLALQGKILISSALEKAARSLYDGKVPELWMEKSYPSLKPLASYVADLKARIEFFQKWYDDGAPVTFWLSGFYFTQSFLTGVLQNFARKYTIPIDEIVFDFEFISYNVEKRPENGAYQWGLFLEGCKFNMETMLLDESDPKDCSNYQNYNCPVYKTTARRGILSTTGHSTNFVLMIRVPTNKPEEHWVKRGVALLTQLDD